MTTSEDEIPSSRGKHESSASSVRPNGSQKYPSIGGKVPDDKGTVSMTNYEVHDMMDKIGKGLGHVPYAFCGMGALIDHGRIEGKVTGLSIIVPEQSKDTVKAWAIAGGLFIPQRTRQRRSRRKSSSRKTPSTSKSGQGQQYSRVLNHIPVSVRAEDGSERDCDLEISYVDSAAFERLVRVQSSRGTAIVSGLPSLLDQWACALNRVQIVFQSVKGRHEDRELSRIRLNLETDIFWILRQMIERAKWETARQPEQRKKQGTVPISSIPNVVHEAFWKNFVERYPGRAKGTMKMAGIDVKAVEEKQAENREIRNHSEMLRSYGHEDCVFGSETSRDSLVSTGILLPPMEEAYPKDKAPKSIWSVYGALGHTSKGQAQDHHTITLLSSQKYDKDNENGSSNEMVGQRYFLPSTAFQPPSGSSAARSSNNPPSCFTTDFDPGGIPRPSNPLPFGRRHGEKRLSYQTLSCTSSSSPASSSGGQPQNAEPWPIFLDTLTRREVIARQGRYEEGENEEPTPLVPMGEREKWEDGGGDGEVSVENDEIYRRRRRRRCRGDESENNHVKRKINFFETLGGKWRDFKRRIGGTASASASASPHPPLPSTKSSFLPPAAAAFLKKLTTTTTTTTRPLPSIAPPKNKNHTTPQSSSSSSPTSRSSCLSTLFLSLPSSASRSSPLRAPHDPESDDDDGDGDGDGDGDDIVSWGKEMVTYIKPPSHQSRLERFLSMVSCPTTENKLKKEKKKKRRRRSSRKDPVVVVVKKRDISNPIPIVDPVQRAYWY